MALPLPTSLSPSKVTAFKNCPLAFRFSAIDKLPEEPSVPAVKGTTVHKALELLFARDAGERTPDTAQECLSVALDIAADDDDYISLNLGASEADSFASDAAAMVARYFTLEDPRRVTPVGTEMMLEANLGSLLVRGIIDRLEEDEQGRLIVTDYKTGRAPSQTQEQGRLGGVHFYALLCERVLGRLPAQVKLIYLGKQPQVITTVPSEQSIRGMERKLGAIWAAVERACELDDFRPRQSALCNWCSFKEFCPAFGGDPNKARALGAAALSSDSITSGDGAADSEPANPPVSDAPPNPVAP